MKRFSTLCLAILATAHGAVPIAGSAAPRIELDSSRRLTIRIYDHAGVAEKALSRAFHEAERIYCKAGIVVTMMRCRTALTDPVLDPRCGERPGVTVLRLNIVPEERVLKSYKNKQIFGIAATALKPDYGVFASVFHGRIRRLAAEWDHRGYDEGIILGHVLAHEAGHLLLGTGSHSDRGIMRIPWHGPELALAHNGGLVFTREQSAILRRDVAERSLIRRANTDSAAVQANQEPDTPLVQACSKATGGSFPDLPIPICVAIIPSAAQIGAPRN